MGTVSQDLNLQESRRATRMAAMKQCEAMASPLQRLTTGAKRFQRRQGGNGWSDSISKKQGDVCTHLSPGV